MDQTVQKAFISVSEIDKAVASELGEALAKKGINPWFYEWEIYPGDSITEKVFEEGIKTSTVFIILLSPASLNSKFVKREFNVALMKKIQQNMRIIAVRVDECDVPEGILDLRWCDLATEGIDGVAKMIADAVYGRVQKPEVTPPSSLLEFPVYGLSEYAAAIAAWLVGVYPHNERGWAYVNGENISQTFQLDSEQVNDAVEELEEEGLIGVKRTSGTYPYSFHGISPNYRLALRLRNTPALDYDPEKDILVIANMICALKYSQNEDLGEQTKLAPWRINNAVDYLKDCNLARVIRTLGTMPYKFLQVEATGATRRFVAENQK